MSAEELADRLDCRGAARSLHARSVLFGRSGMTDWQPIKTAPRDGTWIIIEGEMNGGDTSSALVARWNPITDNGREYEWQTFYGFNDDSFYECRGSGVGDLWNWYSEGRVSQWMPLP